MPKPITRYQCSFCDRHYSTKYDAAKHEGGCLSNPENKSCSTCEHAGTDHCYELNQPIFVKGQKIFNCLSWKERQEY
jgi:hypothetical protein